jgi:hypothetical protein
MAIVNKINHLGRSLQDVHNLAHRKCVKLPFAQIRCRVISTSMFVAFLRSRLAQGQTTGYIAGLD